MTHTVAEILSAMKTQAKQQVPYGISRLLMSATLVVNGLILKQLDKNNNVNSNVAAGPLISAIQFLLLGIGRGYLITTGLKVSKIYGKQKNELNKQEHAEDSNESTAALNQELTKEYNQAISQSLVLAGLITIIQVPICLNADNLVELLNVHPDTAENVYDYFMPFCFGLPAYNLYIIDTQIALATGRSHVTMVSGILFCLAWLTTSWMLSIVNTTGSIAGIGIGFALSSLINCLLLRIYLILTPFHENINILKLDFNNLIANFKQQFKDGSKLAIQRLAEWGNISLLVFTFGNFGNKYLRAQQPSLQLTYIFTTTTLSMIQAQATKVRQYLAITNEQIKDELYKDAFDSHKKTILLGNAGVINGMLLGLAIAAVFVLNARQLSSLFLNDSDLNDDKIISISDFLFVISAATIIIDSMRNYATGALRGLNELSYPPLVSALSMTPPVGIAIAMCYNDKNSFPMLYISRLIGITIAAILITKKWMSRSNSLFKDLCTQAGVTERRYKGIFLELDYRSLRDYGALTTFSADHERNVDIPKKSFCTRLTSNCYNLFTCNFSSSNKENDSLLGNDALDTSTV